MKTEKKLKIKKEALEKTENKELVKVSFPPFDNLFVHHDIPAIKRWIGVIDRAKDLWGVERLEKYPQWKREVALSICTDYPSIALGISEYFIELAETSSDSFDAVLQFLHCDPLDYLPQALEKIISNVRKFNPNRNIEKIDDSLVSAALIITLARETFLRYPRTFYLPKNYQPGEKEIQTMHKILDWENEQNMKRIQAAESLIDKAEKAALRPDAELGQKTRKQRAAFGKRGVEGSKQTAGQYRAIWNKTGKRLRLKHPDKQKYSTRRITELTCDELIKNNECSKEKCPRNSGSLSFCQSIYKYFLKIKL